MANRDARNRTVKLTAPPQRIVSLVPSTTETLHSLGCAERVVGVTRFCCHPKAWTDQLPKIGGTKDVDIQRVLDTHPDLVVGNCEENTAEIFEALDAHVPVWAAFPKTVAQAIEDLRDLGDLVHTPKTAKRHAETIQQALVSLQHAAKTMGSFSYAYLIWRDPWMTISNDTFIANMLAMAGGQNVFGSHADRFPTITLNDIQTAKPDVVLLSSEPFPFKHKHQQEMAQATGLPKAQIRFIDGEYASWHGVRMNQGLRYLHNCTTHGWDQEPK